MLQLALAKVALLLTVTSPAASVPLDLDTAAGFSDLLGHGEPTVSAGELVVNPEYITVPKDYVLDEEALSNITSRSQLPVEARDILGGSDNRFQWDGLDYPFETIGKITWGNGVWCSGTLIGPRHVLNARHCTGLDGDNAGNISFGESLPVLDLHSKDCLTSLPPSVRLTSAYPKQLRAFSTASVLALPWSPASSATPTLASMEGPTRAG